MGFTSFMNSATGGLYGDVKGAVGDVAGTVGSAGQSIINAVKDHPLEAAALAAAGYYFAPQISAWVGPTGETLAGTSAGTSAGTAAGAGAVELGTTSGAAWDAATMGAYGGPAAITAATGLTAAQLATLAKAGVSLAGLMAAKGIQPASSGGLLTQQQQDRSGVSSGSANYSPEYYAAIQSKYNQYMPQQQGKDITTDLKSWYETKYSPAAAQSPFTQAQINQPANINNYIAQQKAINPSAFTTSEQYAAAMDKYGVSPASLSRALNIPEWQVQLEYNRIDPNGKYAATASNLIPQVVSGMQAAGKTNADIAALMDQYKATPAQVAAALGMSTQEVQNLYNTAKPTGLFSTVTQAAPTVAAAIPATQPSYTALTNSSSPAAIAAAYADFVNSSGGDTAFNREAAINYLTNLGVSNDTIGQAYGLFKG
jgi:DNA-binding transcriptional regulator YiaG